MKLILQSENKTIMKISTLDDPAPMALRSWQFEIRFEMYYRGTSIMFKPAHLLDDGIVENTCGINVVAMVLLIAEQSTNGHVIFMP